MFNLVTRAEFLCRAAYCSLSNFLLWVTVHFLKKKKKKRKDFITILICCHTMILYTWMCSLKISYSQASCSSDNLKEEKEMFPKLLNLSWLPTSKFSFYGELPTLTWELKPNSVWRSLILLDEILPGNLSYCKAWLTLPWQKTPRDETGEDKSHPRALADADVGMLSLNWWCLSLAFTILVWRSEMQL